MLIEEGTTKEFKAAVFNTCSFWPVPGELYYVTYQIPHHNSTRLQFTEYWLMERDHWKRREMISRMGVPHMLPLRPEVEFEFSIMCPIADDVYEVNVMQRTRTICTREWEDMVRTCRTKFIGYADNTGSRGEIRVQSCAA